MNIQDQLNNHLTDQEVTTIMTPDEEDRIMIDLTSDIQLSESSDAAYHYFVASPMYAGFGDLGSPERVKFLEEYGQMHPSIKNYFSSADTVEMVFRIGKNNELEDYQISSLGSSIRELLEGKIFIKDFPITISSKLGIDDVKAGEIANKIVQSFGPIIEDVKRIQRSKFPDKIMQLQKESRPEGLNQAIAPKTEDKPQLPPQSVQALPSAVRPPLTMPPRPAAPPLQQPKSATPPPRPEFSKPEPIPASPPSLQQSKPTHQPRPEFKMPNLNPLDSIQQNSPQKSEENKSPTIKADVEAKTGIDESFEKELEKVADVIDLRNKPTEK